jgi:hypothetical protein
MSDERRSSVRVRAYHPVRLYRGGSPQPLETLTKDLGVGGMRSITLASVPVSTELRVELMLAKGDEPVSAKGKAVWFRTIPSSDQFEVGITFCDILERDKRRLSAYIDSKSFQSASV